MLLIESAVLPRTKYFTGGAEWLPMDRWCQRADHFRMAAKPAMPKRSTNCDRLFHSSALTTFGQSAGHRYAPIDCQHTGESIGRANWILLSVASYDVVPNIKGAEDKT
jgi:hypothetical protein